MENNIMKQRAKIPKPKKNMDNVGILQDKEKKLRKKLNLEITWVDVGSDEGR